MSTPLSPEEIRAAAAAHGELGPEYAEDVVASFLDRIDDQISARIDARLGVAARRRPKLNPAASERRRALVKGVVIGQFAAGVPLTVFALLGEHNFWSRSVVAAILLVIVALNAAIVIGLRRPLNDR
jgi:hypothetical protein